MVINMYTVEKIEENIIVLENRNTKELIEIEKERINDVKEKDIVLLKNGEYLIDKKETERIKKDIRNRFNRLNNSYSRVCGPSLDVDGNLVFKKGTLIHGISKYSEGKVEIINAAYLLYNGNYLAAIKKYKEIYLNISNINYIESFVTNLYRSFLRKYNTIRDDYNKLSKEKESKGIFIDIELARASAALTNSNYAEVRKEIIDLIEWACNFECIKVKIDLIRYYYNGNYLFAQDKKKAYELLKSLNGNYGDEKEKFEKMFEELIKIYG